MYFSELLPPGLMLREEGVFASDTILVRALDERLGAKDIYALLVSLGDVQHVDFSFFSFSRSVSASFYDNRHAVAVSANLQQIPGISSCIWKPTRTADDRIVRIPLDLAALVGANWDAVSERFMTFLRSFGDVDRVDSDGEALLVAFFDGRSKARLTARMNGQPLKI